MGYYLDLGIALKVKVEVMQKQSVPSLIALSNMYKHQPLQQRDGLVEVDMDADIDIRFDNPMSTQELGVEMQSNRKNVPNGGATAGGSAKQEENESENFGLG